MMYRDTVQKLAMVKPFKTKYVRTEESLEGFVEYEILSDGKILQVQGQHVNARSICVIHSWPCSILNKDNEEVFSCLDSLLGGSCDLGFLTLKHLEHGRIEVSTWGRELSLDYANHESPQPLASPASSFVTLADLLYRRDYPVTTMHTLHKIRR